MAQVSSFVGDGDFGLADAGNALPVLARVFSRQGRQRFVCLSRPGPVWPQLHSLPGRSAPTTGHTLARRVLEQVHPTSGARLELKH